MAVGRGRDAAQRVDLSNLSEIDRMANTIVSCDRIVLAHGELADERFAERSEEQIVNSIKVNLLSFVRIAEIALAGNPGVRIAAIGSESGLKGSFDIAYALAKAALHRYVEERRILPPQQQLVCVAPSLISDAGMTLRRDDQDNVSRSVEQNPKGRGLTAGEVAEMVYFLLFVDEGYTSNVVIDMNGGKFARM